jgi:predicted amidohydrolase
VPGVETEAIAAKAKQHNCYISFGTYAQDRAWPNHVISMTVFISPEGKVISKQWKHRNIHGVFTGFELFTSSVYDVLDQYVEMYGWDAVIPVARTDIGNLCASPCVHDAELYRCMALKGAEFILRTATGGAVRWAADMPVWCRVNRVYGGWVGNSISPDNPGFLESGTDGSVSSPGGTKIFGPDGNTIGDTLSQAEDIVVARVPMAAFRKTHRLPDVFMPMYRHLYDAYPARIEPNAYSEGLPKSLDDANRLWKTKVKW